jgi:predicted TIM-barrel fold metal-dependent hydrolase
MVLPPGSLPVIGEIARRHPGLKFVIDHLARDFGDLLALARRPNIAVKATSLPSYSSHPYPYRNLHSYIRQVYDAFGPSRMFWGTDLSRLPCTYRQAVTMFTEELAFLSEGDKELIMGRAVCDWLGWPI